MNNFLNNLERRFGRYAINNLTLYIIGLYVVGYILQFAPAGVNISAYLTLDPYRILHGQIWRLVTWVVIPPSSLNIFTLITLYFYYFIGTTMERTMGTFKYNLFIFGGMLFMILAAFCTMLVYRFGFGVSGDALGTLMLLFSAGFSTYYLQESLFLAFALFYPNLQVLLMFIIPVKVKWLGIIYSVMLAYQCLYTGLIKGNYWLFFAILSQFINLFLFYAQTGKLIRFKPSEVKRREDFARKTKIMPKGVTRHKCAVCGRSEIDNPNLEFRFCSKCNGNYEYCQDHLFTHQHVK